MPGESECNAGQQQSEAGAGEREFPDFREIHGAGLGINERHAKKEERGGSGSQDQIFDAGFEGFFASFGIRDQGVQGNAWPQEAPYLCGGRCNCGQDDILRAGW